MPHLICFINYLFQNEVIYCIEKHITDLRHKTISGAQGEYIILQLFKNVLALHAGLTSNIIHQRMHLEGTIQDGIALMF